MGCKFCESGRLKKVRNLEVYEMVQQILMVGNDIDEKITHIVLMGIGEPFDNYDNVEIGCNTVLNPGTIIGRNTTVYPLSFVRGVVKENSIYKDSNNIVDKK